jgi:hypothetical protein
MVMFWIVQTTNSFRITGDNRQADNMFCQGVHANLQLLHVFGESFSSETKISVSGVSLDERAARAQRPEG